MPGKNAAKALHFLSTVRCSPSLSYGDSMDDLAETLREKAVAALESATPAKAVLVRGDDGRFYTFAIKVVPVKLDRDEECDAILEACPFVFIIRSVLMDRYLVAVCPETPTMETLASGRYTIIRTFATRRYSVQYAQRKLQCPEPPIISDIADLGPCKAATPANRKED